MLLGAVAIIAVARLDLLLPGVRLEVLRVRLEATFAQVLLEGNGHGELQRGALDELLGGAVGGHVRVHVVPMLQLALRALRLQRLKVLQVAQLEVLIRPTSGLCSSSEKERINKSLQCINVT